MHFHNEEYILPWWLKHHVELFDHGVLINHNSTDSSADICREITPHWDVVDSSLSEFSAVETDSEVMRYEASLPGWKMALNATEFLVCTPEHLNEKLQILNFNNQRCLQTRGVVMADIAPDQRPSKDIPLIRQKCHGYFEEEHVYLRKRRVNLWKIISTLRLDLGALKNHRNRIMHSYSTGAYSVGRHATSHRIDERSKNIYTFWYGFSPWSSEMVARKLQFKSRIPRMDRERGVGFQHLFDRDELSSRFNLHRSKSRDLSRLLP